MKKYSTKAAINRSNSLRKVFSTTERKILSSVSAIIFLAVCVLIAPVSLQAQTATVYGALGNFDVINHTGHDGHGFEIEMEGIHPEDVYYSFSAQRYGAATVTATATGVKVRWASGYGNGAFAQTTLPHAPNTPFAGSCYQWGANYNQSACEHFGVSLTAAPTHTAYRWLIEDANNPGTLIGFDPPVAIVTPIYTITPPAAGEAPVLEAEIEAPEAAETEEVYGDAQWVKVFKTQLTREANLDELVSDNAVVPQNTAQTEVQWEIIQAEPVSHGNGANRGRRRHSEVLNFNTRSVLRRYETYAYTGAYDPVTHEAVCADALCTAPAANEVGEFIGAQMTAANVVVHSVAVTKIGSGSVTSADQAIKCGSKCGAGYNQGTLVTLTAAPASNSVFAGWGGACGGTTLSCTVAASNAVNVTARFAAPISVLAKTSGKGTIKSQAIGIDCGKNCRTTVASNTTATFTAAPEAGFRFTGWSGACAGTSAVCTVLMNGDTTVQANFAK